MGTAVYVQHRDDILGGAEQSAASLPPRGDTVTRSRGNSRTDRRTTDRRGKRKKERKKDRKKHTQEGKWVQSSSILCYITFRLFLLLLLPRRRLGTRTTVGRKRPMGSYRILPPNIASAIAFSPFALVLLLLLLFSFTQS